jgi:hypothetical protein
MREGELEVSLSFKMLNVFTKEILVCQTSVNVTLMVFGCLLASSTFEAL